MKTKSQAAIEYMLIFSIVAAALVPVALIVFRTTQPEIDSAAASQMYSVGLKMMSTAEDLYYTGHPSKVTYEEYFPVALRNILLIEDEDTAGNIVWHGINFGLTHDVFVPVVTKIPITVTPTGLSEPMSSGTKRIVMQTNINADGDLEVNIEIK